MKRVSPGDGKTPSRLAWTLAGVFFAVFVACALARFYNLGYWCTDLGEYGNLAYNTGHGRLFIHSYNGVEIRFAHCAPMLFLLAPLAYVFPEPVYVVVIVVASSAAIIPLIYYFGATRGARWAALALAASYALSTYVHGATLYENPFRPVGAVLLMGALLLFTRRRFAWGAACTVLAATASEEIAVYAVVVAALSIWLTRRRLAGVILTAVLAVYAAVVCFYLYPKLAFGYAVLPNLSSYVRGVREAGLTTLVEAKGVIPLSPRLWYFVTALAPVAWFLPFAGLALALLPAPAAVFATHDNASIVRHGFGFSFQFLPFAYAAAAFGLHRVCAPLRVSARRFVLVAGSVTAVVFQVALIAGPYRPWYVGMYREARPSYHRLGVLAGIRRLPPDVSLSVDRVAFAMVAHRPVATLFPHGLGLGGLAPVEGIFLDRDFHRARMMPCDLGRLRAAGYYPAEVTRDYAYFTRRPGPFTYEDVWDSWYGSISESNFLDADGYRRPRRDAAAPLDGVVLPVRREAFLLDHGRYFFPRGWYRLDFVMAAAEEDVKTRATFVVEDPDTGEVRRSVERRWDVGAGDGYGDYMVRFRLGRPSALRITVDGTGPFLLDGVRVYSGAYTLARAERHLPWPWGTELFREDGRRAGSGSD
ncbi:MAG: DUF2079 domain-containing protein [Candidatus Zixiibacteriota bacterium]